MSKAACQLCPSPLNPLVTPLGTKATSPSCRSAVWAGWGNPAGVGEGAPHLPTPKCAEMSPPFPALTPLPSQPAVSRASPHLSRQHPIPPRLRSQAEHCRDFVGLGFLSPLAMMGSPFQPPNLQQWPCRKGLRGDAPHLCKHTWRRRGGGGGAGAAGTLAAPRCSPGCVAGWPWGAAGGRAVP